MKSNLRRHLARDGRWRGILQRSVVEMLEGRTLLSGAVFTPGYILDGATPVPAATASAADGTLSAPFTPGQIDSAYGINNISFDGVTGGVSGNGGSGQTIAVVDAYNDPNIIADTNTFSTTYGLPQFNGSGEPTMTVLNQIGGTSLPGVSPRFDDWTLEESLDVEWVHAIAPKANIVVFEADDDNSYSNLLTAATTAAGYAGVSVVSMSWGESEFTGEQADDSIFLTPTGHQGVTFVSSAGDNGEPATYPAFSPNVIGVGGTTLTINSDGSYGGEIGWSDGGGGISEYESQPAYQSGKVNGLSSSYRTSPDVAMDGDPNTGVNVYDSYRDDGWNTIGGTSLGCPIWAGLVAMADQGRASEGLATLDGASQALPNLYSLESNPTTYADCFNDITSGNNGDPASTGYDLVTGLGTPIAGNLVPALADVGAAPAITTQPISQSVKAGSTVNFTAAATGTPTPTVQWDFSTNGGASYAPITGATSTTYSFTANMSQNGYLFEAVFTNTDGSKATNPATLTVTPATASKLVFTTQPVAAAAGSTMASVVVTIEDQYGDVETADTSTVTLGGPGTLAGTTTINAVKGVATFNNLSVTKSGSYTFSASDSADSLSGFTSGSFTISAAVAAKLVFTTQPVGAAAGATMDSVVVTIEDTYGNVEAADTSKVTLGGPGTLAGTNPVSAVAGVATFGNLSITKSGSSYTFSASDSTDSLSGFTSNSFTISAAVAAKLVFTTQPVGATAGATMDSVVVTIEDTYGNVEAADTSKVTLGGPDTLAGTNPVSAVAGVATFNNLSITKSGTDTFSVSDSTDSLSGFTSSSFAITAAAAAKLAFGQPPTDATAGKTISPAVTVDVEDGFGNVVTTDDSTVAISVNSGPGTLAGTASADAVDGVATFANLSLATAGMYTFKASDGSLSSTLSGSFTVSTITATQLAFVQQPTGTTAGSTISPAVTVYAEDASDELATSYESNVTVAIASGPAGAALGGFLTVKAVDGVATFSNLSLTEVGSYTFQATYRTVFTPAISDGFTITAAAPAKLAFRHQPTATTVGSIINLSSGMVTAIVEDTYGNVCKTYASNVTIGIASGPAGAVLGGYLTVKATNGVAIFSNLTLNEAGTYTLAASHKTLAVATSNSFVISAAASPAFVIFGSTPILPAATDEADLATMLGLDFDVLL